MVLNCVGCIYVLCEGDDIWIGGDVYLLVYG